MGGGSQHVRQILKADPDAHAVVNEVSTHTDDCTQYSSVAAVQEGDTPLLVAAERKQETVLRMLIRSGAEINYQNPVRSFASPADLQCRCCLTHK